MDAMLAVEAPEWPALNNIRTPSMDCSFADAPSNFLKFRCNGQFAKSMIHNLAEGGQF